MSLVELKELSKNFGKVVAVDNVSAKLAKGKITVFLGPSGCGKTTCLRCIAGLEKPNSGDILIDDKVVSGSGIFVPPEKRNMGMVFQSYAIWPHMTVFENVAYPLKTRKHPKDYVAQKVSEVLKLVRLEGLEERYGTQLSGGQQQRVALARSLVYDPKVLLLDEPLSNLDATLRESTRFELRELQIKLGLTMIYVTHDQAEAMAISDEIIVMNNGKIMERGTSRSLYLSPCSSFVAGFVGTTNLIPGTFLGNSGKSGMVKCERGALVEVPLNKEIEQNREVLLSIRPEDIYLSRAKPAKDSCGYACKILKETFLGNFTSYVIDVDGVGELRVQSNVKSLHVGDSIFACFDPLCCVVIRN